MKTTFFFLIVLAGFLLTYLVPDPRGSFLLVTFSTIFLYYDYFRKLVKNGNDSSTKNNLNKLPLPPGPKPWPIVGCLPEMLTNRPGFRWVHNLMRDLNTEIVCIKLANVHVIAVTSPKIGLEFLRKQDSNFASRPKIVTTCIASRGYLCSAFAPAGDQWNKMRKALSLKVVTPERFKLHHPKRVEEADHLVRTTYKAALCNGGIVNVRDITQGYCGNVIRKLVFGRRTFGDQDHPAGRAEQEHVDAAFKILGYLFSFCLSDYVPFLSCLDFEGQGKLMEEAVAVMNKYHDPIIHDRIQKHRGYNNNAKIEVEQEQDDLLDVLVMLKDEHGNPLLSAEEIKAEILLLMIAAMDNPSSAAEWALAEMINQPELLKRATEEIDKVVGKDRLIQESDFANLNYVKACAKEAFRLHPVSPFSVPHLAISDATVAGYFIPKGSHILVSRMGLGRNPRTWHDPLRFSPERHLNNKDDQGGLSNIAFQDPNLKMFTFGTGRRGCLGMSIGTSMTIMLLGRLLQAFSWSPPPGMDQVDISESDDSLFLARPLLALANPRISKEIIEG